MQLLAVSAEADARAKLWFDMALRWKWDSDSLVSGVTLEPRVVDARLALHDFRLRRISKLDGPAVRELSNSLREVVEHVLAERHDKLVAHAAGRSEND